MTNQIPARLDAAALDTIEQMLTDRVGSFQDQRNHIAMLLVECRALSTELIQEEKDHQESCDFARVLAEEKYTLANQCDELKSVNDTLAAELETARYGLTEEDLQRCREHKARDIETRYAIQDFGGWWRK